MKMTKIQLDNALRATYLELISTFLTERGEEVLVTNSNEISIPVCDADGNDKFVQITVKVPKGSRDGEEFDAYTARDMFAEAQAEKLEKKKKAETAKLAKIERDKKMREKKKAEKAERNAEK